MNKAIQRQGVSVVFVHASKSDHIIKDLKGKVLFSSRNLSAVMKYLHQNQQLSVVKVEKGEVQSLPKPSKVVAKSLPTPIHKTQQYTTHHEEARLHKRTVKKTAAKFGVEDEVAEKIVEIIGSSEWAELSEEQCEKINLVFP